MHNEVAPKYITSTLVLSRFIQVAALRASLIT